VLAIKFYWWIDPIGAIVVSWQYKFMNQNYSVILVYFPLFFTLL
jgi:hypothetical protein